jgi:hypothetical protein
MSVDPSTPPTRPPLASAPPAAAPALPAAPAIAAKERARQVSFWQSFMFGMTRPGELPIYHHSTLFYWWPIWLLGFLFAGFTYFEDRHMAIVPPGTQAAADRQVEIDDKGTTETRHVLILPKNEKLVTVKDAHGETVPLAPTIYMAKYRSLGSTFVIVLLLVIVITSITLRGLWSVLVLVTIVMLAIIFWAAGWWETILSRLGQLGIYINLGGYFTIAVILFALWVFNIFVMDRQTYMIFTPGQVRVRLEIGGGEDVYDTAGMVFYKQRSDLFRHWVLGFGSGDLVLRPAGLGYALELPNVLRVGRKVKQIEQMVKEKVVIPDVSSPGPPASTL